MTNFTGTQFVIIVAIISFTLVIIKGIERWMDNKKSIKELQLKNEQEQEMYEKNLLRVMLEKKQTQDLKKFYEEFEKDRKYILNQINEINAQIKS